MGWTFFADHNPNQTRADIIRREFEQTPSDKNPWAYGFEYIAERGATVYAVMWRENPSENVPRHYFGMVFLTQRKKGEFGYKEIGEECGPCEHAAPLRMINLLDKLAPDVGGYAAKWRQSVREYHAKRKARAKLCAGAVVQLGGRQYKLIEPRRAFFSGRAAGWYALGLADGLRYRMSAQHAARAQLVEA
jgi:hypothetical protein